MAGQHPSDGCGEQCPQPHRPGGASFEQETHTGFRGFPSSGKPDVVNLRSHETIDGEVCDESEHDHGEENPSGEEKAYLELKGGHRGSMPDFHMARDSNPWRFFDRDSPYVSTVSASQRKKALKTGG